MKLLVVAACTIAVASLPAADSGRAANPGGGNATQDSQVTVPEHLLDVVLGRPTPTSIAVSLMGTQKLDVRVSFGVRSVKERGTAVMSLTAGVPRVVSLTSLKPASRYVYRVLSRKPGASGFSTVARGTFHLPRPRGSSFVFIVQADSHLDSNSSASVYQRSLRNQLADAPDLMFDLGDTFMTDKFSPYTAASRQYLAQRYYIGIVGKAAPVFLALGNHDGESGFASAKGQGAMPHWSARQRNAAFPNPGPNRFYSGNETAVAGVGKLRDYYAFEWGDALFVVLDPYWFTTQRSTGDDNWSWTLGKAQYDWLAQTLRKSEAKLKFVFLHHLVGGGGNDHRGGVEVARFFEWGGANVDGTDGFTAHRPGWEMPIHELLVRTGVTAVFHGHDHLYAHQTLDGIDYQEVQQPSNAREQSASGAAAYGYVTGKILGGPGYLRVAVSGGKARVEYIRTSTTGASTKVVADTYSLP